MRSRRASLMLVATVSVVLIAASIPASGAGVESWRESLVIDTARAGPEKMFEAFDTASLNLYDFNGDGRLEIISNNDNNRVYVIDSGTGKVLAELQTYHYNNSKWPARELNPVAIGDLYGDGVPCMVVPNSASFLTAFCYDAAGSSSTRFNFVEKWRVKVDAALYEKDFKETHPYLYHPNGTAKHTAGMDGHAYLADVDGDGKLEIFVETDSWPGQFSFTHDGKYRWSRSFSDGNAGAIVRDIDKDGVKDAVFFGDGGLVTAYNAKTGSIKWNFDTRKHGATPGSIPVPGLVVDLHGDGRYETVFGARQAVQTNDPNWINQSHAQYYALDHRGQILWHVSYDWMNPLQYNHPAAIDVNGDGVLDVVFLDWNTIGHKPGNWNTTNRKSNLFVLNGKDGSVIWHKGITIYWSNKDFVIMDVDGDGSQEIVAPTAKNGKEGLGIYDLKTGADKGFFAAGDGWSMTRGPVAGDLDGDGDVELIVPFNRRAEGTNYRSIDVGYREGKLVIIETGAAKSGLKFSANFLLNDEIDLGAKGTSGTPPTPVTPTPVTPTPTQTTPTASPTPETTPTQTTTTPTPAETTPTPTATTPAPTETTPSPTAEVTPSTPIVTATVPPTATATATPPPTSTVTPTSTPQESLVPGAGVALALAALAAVAVLVRRRR